MQLRFQTPLYDCGRIINPISPSPLLPKTKIIPIRPFPASFNITFNLTARLSPLLLAPLDQALASTLRVFVFSAHRLRRRSSSCRYCRSQLSIRQLSLTLRHDGPNWTTHHHNGPPFSRTRLIACPTVAPTCLPLCPDVPPYAATFSASKIPVSCQLPPNSGRPISYCKRWRPIQVDVREKEDGGQALFLAFHLLESSLDLVNQEPKGPIWRTWRSFWHSLSPVPVCSVTH